MIGLLDKDHPVKPDLVAPENWPSAQNARIEKLFNSRQRAKGDEKDAFRASKVGNPTYYGTPHVMNLYQDASLTPWSIFDPGISPKA